MEELKELELTKKLTPRQERFCQEYINIGVAARAYALAYEKNYDDPKVNLVCRVESSKLLTNDNIKARVDELKEEQRKQCVVDRQLLIDKSMDILINALKGTPEMKLNREGKFVPTGNMIRDTKGANEAIKNIANMLGLNEQTVKAEIEAKADVNVISAKELANELIES